MRRDGRCGGREAAGLRPAAAPASPPTPLPRKRRLGEGRTAGPVSGAPHRRGRLCHDARLPAATPNGAQQRPSRSEDRPVRMRRIPHFANSCAMAIPMPPLAPVTSAVLSFSESIVLSRSAKVHSRRSPRRVPRSLAGLAHRHDKASLGHLLCDFRRILQTTVVSRFCVPNDAAHR